MVKNKNVNKILYILLAFLIAAVAIVLPFTMNKKQNSVYADESGFASSTIYVPFIWSQVSTTSLSGYYNYSNQDNFCQYCYFNFSLVPSAYNSNEFIFTLNGQYKNISTSNVVGTLTTLMFYRFTDSGNDNSVLNTFNVDPFTRYTFIGRNSGDNIVNGQNPSWGFVFTLAFDGLPITSTSYFMLDNVVSLTMAYNTSDGFMRYQYTDINGRYFVVGVRCNEPLFNTYGFTTRTYYLNQNNSISDSVAYQTGYNEGYSQGQSLGYDNGVSDGYSQGQSEGYNDGYTAGNAAGQTTGYDTGYSAGDAAGYIRGLTDSNQYTFTNLISATIDAPVSALTGLLNFEILGVNLSAFIYGLFTISLVIVVIKYIKGGGSK